MKKILLGMVAVVFLISCNQGKDKGNKADQSPPSPGMQSNNEGENKITFKVDGAGVNTEGWVVQRFLWDKQTPVPWLNITSNMHLDKQTINVNLNGASAGTYSLSQGGMMKNSHGAFFPDFSNPMASYSFTSGEFNITTIDTVKNLLNGTFSGTAKSADGKTVLISDGQLINVKVKAGVTDLSAPLN